MRLSPTTPLSVLQAFARVVILIVTKAMHQVELALGNWNFQCEFINFNKQQR